MRYIPHALNKHSSTTRVQSPLPSCIRVMIAASSHSPIVSAQLIDYSIPRVLAWDQFQWADASGGGSSGGGGGGGYVTGTSGGDWQFE